MLFFGILALMFALLDAVTTKLKGNSFGDPPPFPHHILWLAPPFEAIFLARLPLKFHNPPTHLIIKNERSLKT